MAAKKIVDLEIRVEPQDPEEQRRLQEIAALQQQFSELESAWFTARNEREQLVAKQAEERTQADRAVDLAERRFMDFLQAHAGTVIIVRRPVELRRDMGVYDLYASLGTPSTSITTQPQSQGDNTNNSAPPQDPDR